MPKSEFVLAQYLGGNYVHPVNTPTGELFHKHGKPNYGFHKRGDRFEVLVVDVKKRPDLFAAVVEDEEVPPADDESDEPPADTNEGEDDDPVNDDEQDSSDESEDEAENTGSDDSESDVAVKTPKPRGGRNRK